MARADQTEEPVTSLRKPARSESTELNDPP